MSSLESDSKSVNSDSEYPDHVHECLKYVPIFKKGTFSCSSRDDCDDDDDDEDVKRILAEYSQSETEDCKAAGFSSVYMTSVAEMNLQSTDGLQSAGTADVDDPADYEDWNDALKDACTAYPPLGVSSEVFETEIRRLDDETLDFHAAKISDGEDGRRLSVVSSSARELRRCLEGALYGRDVTDFVVAQPFCVANKNLDFGKPVMSNKALQDSRKKVENWMSKYIEEENTISVLNN